MRVKPKKHLGQHFLRDTSIAEKIANTLTMEGYDMLLEIGPGTGVLTTHLLKKSIETFVIEIDFESVSYLKSHFLSLSEHIIEGDILKYNFSKTFGKRQFAIIGNFPYNISTQIIFKMLMP